MKTIALPKESSHFCFSPEYFAFADKIGAFNDKNAPFSY